MNKRSKISCVSISMEHQPGIYPRSVIRCSGREVCTAVLSILATLALPAVGEAATAGVYSAAKGLFYLTTPTDGASAPTSVKIDGARKNWLPVLGVGSFKYGLYDRKTGTFHLRMEESSGPITKSVQFEGFNKNWLPVAGDWDGDRAYGLGLYDPKSGTFHLKNQLTSGPADSTVRLVNSKKHWMPLTGDWDGDGTATIGAYDPRSGQFHLRNLNTDGPADLTLQIQGLKKNLLPVAADWDNDGTWSPGLYSPASHSFYWRNALDSGPLEGSVKLTGVKANVLPVASSVSRATSAPSPTPPPVATDVGTPIGAPATATIGVAGGTLRSPDNTLLLSIPPGALAADTAISIQPITNHAHGRKGNAYRLTPDGQTFQKPVTLTFGYTDGDLLGTAAEVLGGAYQTPEGYWRWINDPVVDTAAKTVTIATTHFTDFSLVEGLNLRPYETKVMVNGNVKLVVKNCYPYFGPEPAGPDSIGLGYECDSLGDDTDDLLASLVRVTEWAVNGVPAGGSALGTIGGAQATSATYTAPAKKPKPDTVAVSARLKSPAGMILVSHITIVEDVKVYRGTVDFELNEVVEKINGTANITWTLIEDGTGSHYQPAGNIFLKFNYQHCKPVETTIPVRTTLPPGIPPGTPFPGLGVMTLGPAPNKYDFYFTGDPSATVVLACQDGPDDLPYERIFKGEDLLVGVPNNCLDKNIHGFEEWESVRPSYTDKLTLWGFAACLDDAITDAHAHVKNVTWSFEGAAE